MNKFEDIERMWPEANATRAGIAEKARNFAIEHHKNEYDKGPYVVHLDHVAEIALKYLSDKQIWEWLDFYDWPGDEKEFIKALAYLHDVLEDCKETVKRRPDSEDDGRIALQSEFGQIIADAVWYVTDEEGANRKDRKLKTWHKIRYSRYSMFIKLCDRLANTSFDGKPWPMYVKEFPAFEAALYIPGSMDKLWEDLRKATYG